MTMGELPPFYDIAWTPAGDKPQLKLLTDDGIEYHDFPFRPYCYIQERDCGEDVFRAIAEVDETAELVKVHSEEQMVHPHHHARPDTYYDDTYWKVHVERPSLIRKLRQELEHIGVETMQSDVPYARRVMIDLQQSVETPDEILSFDIEVEAHEGVPDPEEAANRIYTICAIGSDGEEYSFAYDDEEETIREFLDVAVEYKAVLGWNSFKFDYPYLVNRTRNLNMGFDWFNIVHVDALPTYRHILLKYQPNYRLTTIAEAEFDMTYPEIDFDVMDEIFANDRERLVEYNMNDVRVVKMLDDKFGMKDVTFDVLASAGYCRPRDIFFVREDLDYQRVTKASNVLIEGVVLGLTGDRVVWPNKGSAREEFEGAKVLDPKGGKYEYVATLDYASMYPSIISALNIGPETYRPDGSGAIDAPIGSFAAEPQSIFSQAYHVLKDERDAYQEKVRRLTRGSPEWTIAKAYSRGIKQYVNTFYGVIGSPYSRFYNRDVAENITLMGQAMLTRAAEYAEELGYTTVYGDTDSVMVELNGHTDVVDEGYWLADEISSEIRRFVRDEYGGDPSLIELTLDEIYSPFFITDSRKRYAGYCVYDGESCFTFEKVGFEMVRGDWPDATKEFQEELTHAILRDRDEWQLIEEWKERLYDGELDDKLVKHVGLRRKPESYKSTPPHVRVAKRYEGTEHEIRVGDKVPYIKYGNDPEKVVGVVDGELPNLTVSNYSYIWGKNFQSIIDRFGIEEHEVTTISDFVQVAGD